MSKKINLFTAEKSFSESVAMFMVKNVWRKQYQEELKEAIENERASISGLENMRGSAIMTDQQVNEAIAEREAMIETYRNAYQSVVTEWVNFSYPDSAKALYKGYKSATNTAEVYDAFAEFLSEYGLNVGEDCELIESLISATRGDSAGSNIAQFAKYGVASVEKRGRSEFLRIVYRRLFDAMVQAGTIRVVGCTIKSAGQEIATYEVEIPELVQARYAKKSKKSAK